MRILGIDVGQRRVGLAISDPSGTLARPLMTLQVTSPAEAVDRITAEVLRLATEDEGLATIVVGMPARLDGSPTTQTSAVIALIEALAARTPVPIVTEGEQLTSREAESRLAAREHDWRKRKEQLDAVAAAIILQDYLDRRPT